MIEHLLEFFGRTHLVVLHFPIALVIVAAIVEVSRVFWIRVQRRPQRDPFRPSSAGSVMLAFAFAATLVSIASGLVLGFDGGTRVDLHRILGIVSGVLMLVTGIALVRAMRPASRGGMVYVVLLGCSAAVVGFTGHLGGELTHGKGFLTKPLERMVGIEDTVVGEVDGGVDLEALGITQASFGMFTQSVLPILQRSCVECHGPDDAEDDIRLDSIAYVLDPDADMIRRDDPEMSELLYRIDLPHDDPDIMPPEGDGDPLSSDEIELVRTWIASLSS